MGNSLRSQGAGARCWGACSSSAGPLSARRRAHCHCQLSHPPALPPVHSLHSAWVAAGTQRVFAPSVHRVQLSVTSVESSPKGAYHSRIQDGNMDKLMLACLECFISEVGECRPNNPNITKCGVQGAHQSELPRPGLQTAVRRPPGLRPAWARLEANRRMHLGWRCCLPCSLAAPAQQQGLALDVQNRRLCLCRQSRGYAGCLCCCRVCNGTIVVPLFNREADAPARHLRCWRRKVAAW